MIYDKLKTIIIYGIGGTVLFGLLWLMLRFALPILLPFIIAYVLSCPLRLGAKKLGSLTKMNENVLKALLLASSLGAIAILLWLGASNAIGRLRGALAAVSKELSGEGGLIAEISLAASDFAKRIGGEEFSEALGALFTNATSQLSAYIARAAASIISALPSLAIGAAISIASLFYFTFGYEKTAKALSSILPKKQKTKICQTASKATKGLGRFIKAYSTIILVTFTELFTGFLILRIKHPFMLALVISIVDFLPIIGVGGVLIPWAAASFFLGKTGQAVGLLVITAVSWAVRQPVESKLIGRGAGVHPIFALASVYTGFRISGVFGMVAAPVLLTATAVVLREKKTEQP